MINQEQISYIRVLYNFKRNSVRYCSEQIVHCLSLRTPFFLLSFKKFENEYVNLALLVWRVIADKINSMDL